MSRYIDADHFDERVRLAGGMSEDELTTDFKDGVQATLVLLSTEPTADVVEVIYCEECKHKEYCSQNIAKFGKGYDMYEAIRYCSYGERRTDESVKR